MTATALLHQSLSVIAERGGARADALYRTLCGPGPFASVSPALFSRLLRGTGWPEARLIEQAPDGLLMLGEVGEKVVGSRDSYALFERSEEWRLVNGGRALGTIPLNNPAGPDHLLVFAGRRWVVLSIDERAWVIEVAPHRSGSIPTFERSSVEPIHDRLAAEMLGVYREAEVPAWLDRWRRTCSARDVRPSGATEPTVPESWSAAGRRTCGRGVAPGSTASWQPR